MKRGSLRKTQMISFFYQIGDRVRLQNIVTKEFKLFGTITNLRLADDGAVVSYGIATDKGYNTTRHRRFLRPLAPEQDPKVAKYNHKERDISKPSLLGKSIEMTNTTDLPDVLTNDESADLTEKLNVEKPRRSSRIQKHKSDSIRFIRSRVKRVRTSSITSLSSIGSPDITMGGSCSTQLQS